MRGPVLYCRCCTRGYLGHLQYICIIPPITNHAVAVAAILFFFFSLFPVNFPLTGGHPSGFSIQAIGSAIDVLLLLCVYSYLRTVYISKTLRNSSCEIEVFAETHIYGGLEIWGMTQTKFEPAPPSIDCAGAAATVPEI